LGPHQKQVALESPNCPAGEDAVARRPMRQPRKGVLALKGNDAAAGRRLCFRRDGPAPKAGASTWKDPNCGRRLGTAGRMEPLQQGRLGVGRAQIMDRGQNIFTAIPTGLGQEPGI
jgi:hypothetical protein